MKIMFCTSFKNDMWGWVFYNGFKKLGHDIKWVGFGGHNEEWAQAMGATSNWDNVKENYTEKEIAQFQGDFKYRLDVPLPDWGLVIDGEKANYLWEDIEHEVCRWCDDWLPDIIFIFEQDFGFIGDKPKRYRGIPIGYFMGDNRGTDGQYRYMKRSQVDFCFINNSYYWQIYKYQGVNPIGVVPTCVDTDIFKFYEDEPIGSDVYFSGGIGLDLNCQMDEGDLIDMGLQHWDKLKYCNPVWGEAMHRAEFIRGLSTCREFDFQCTGRGYSNPEDWARAMNRTKINFNPGGHLYPSRHAIGHRLFAAPACGPLLFTQWDYDLYRYYKDGEEIISFKEYSHPRHHEMHWFDLKVVKDKICYYLLHEREREEIAANGLKATTERHECKVRAREVLDMIEQAGFN